MDACLQLEEICKPEEVSYVTSFNMAQEPGQKRWKVLALP